MQYLQISFQTKQNAQDILGNTKVLDILSKYGQVRIGGSFYTNLMYGPDIDLNITTQNPQESALSFLNEVISLKLFQKYQFGDFINFPRTNRPQDIIVVLILPYQNQQWEIEIWFSNKEKTEQINLEEKLVKLPQDIKNKIIEDKHLRATSNTDKHQLSSFEIYKNYVLE